MVKFGFSIGLFLTICKIGESSLIQLLSPKEVGRTTRSSIGQLISRFKSLIIISSENKHGKILIIIKFFVTKKIT